jgi:hypothetical protein
MCQPVALGAKGNQIIGMVVQFVAVDVMNVKMYTPMLAALATMLACPLIAILDCFADALPVGGILPFGHAALPCGILFASGTSAQNERFRQGTNAYPVEFQGALDSGWADLKNVRDLRYRMVLFGVKPVQLLAVNSFVQWMKINRACSRRSWPELMVWAYRVRLACVWSVCRLNNLAMQAAVMALSVFEPSVIRYVPFNTLPTSASTQGSRFSWRRMANDGLAWPMFSRLGVGPARLFIALEDQLNQWARAAEMLRCLAIRWVVTSVKTRPVVGANLQLLLWCK